MKKIASLGVIVCLTCTFLCACGAREAAGVEAPAGDHGSAVTAQAEPDAGAVLDDGGGEAESPQPKESAAVKVEDIVGQQFRFTGQRGDEEMGYLIDADYTVPRILSDADAARAVNDEIRTFCLDVIEPTGDELDYPTWDSVGYEAYLNGDILSLVITKGCALEDGASYAAFNYNIKEDRTVDNAGLIRSCGYTERSFAERMRKAVVYEADRNMQAMFGAYYWNSKETADDDRQLMYADSMRCRQNSIAADKISLEMPMYLDEAGQLKAVTEIDTPAGAGFYLDILTPGAESAARDFDISFEDSLFIVYKDGSMTIRIEEGDWTSNTFGGSGSYLEFGKEYKVEGVYKDYIDGAMQFVADGEYAVPVFVSDDGMVSALNIYYGAYAGYFCLTEPVMGLTEIEAITETNGSMIAENVGNTLLGQCCGFAKRTLDLYGIEGFQKTYGDGGEEDGTYGYYIGFDEDEEGTFLYQQYPSGLNYSGECVLLGMNEDGLIFSARVCADDSFDTNDHYGAFSLKKYSRWNEAVRDIVSWAEFKELGGYMFFDGEAELIKLDVTNG